MRGLFITVDGIDGVGKSTFCNNIGKQTKALVCSSIEASGQKHISFALAEGMHTRDIHLLSLDYILKSTVKAKDLLSTGRDVIFDRYIYSCIAYYVAISQKNNEPIKFPNYASYNFLRPDIALILYLDRETRVSRLLNRGTPFDHTDTLTLDHTFSNSLSRTFGLLSNIDANTKLVDARRSQDELVDFYQGVRIEAIKGLSPIRYMRNYQSNLKRILCPE